MKFFKGVLSGLMLLASLGAFAQSNTEIELAKSMARQYGYSEDEINKVMNHNIGGSATQAATNGTVAPVVDRQVEAPTVQSIAVQPVEAAPAAERPVSIFGESIFSSSNLNFVPSFNLPTPTDYKLAPGDEVVIDIWGDTYMNYSLKISPEGCVSIPDLGPVYLAGNTVDRAQSLLKSHMSRIFSGMNGNDATTFISLTLGKIRSFTVNVVGDAVKPGTYTIPSLSTFFSALYLAGGPSKIGSFRDIKLYRGNKLKATLDIYDFLVDGNFTKNIRLEDNDLIVIGSYKKHVTIQGSVKRPMIYDMKDNETLSDLLKFAAGFSSNAKENVVSVVRTKGTRTESFDVEASQFAAFTFEDGDIVSVASNYDRNRNIVTINGAVQNPGSYAIAGNNTSVKTLIELAGGLREEAYLENGLISRYSETREPVYVNFIVRDVLSGKAVITLQPEDVVQIYDSNTFVEAGLTITTSGELNNPGVKTFRPGMTLEDAILQSGGYTLSAVKYNIQIARRVVDTDVNATEKRTEVIPINLDENPEKLSFMLAPYDMIFVRKAPSYVDQTSVGVNGEVLYPGTYAIESTVVRLSDVIARSGGFTKDAYLKGVSVSRTATGYDAKRSEDALKNLNKFVSHADSSVFDGVVAGTTYMIAVDVEKAVNNPGSDYDLVLQSGDVVNVPKLNNIVRISGGVLQTNVVSYQHGMSYKSYIHRAGGYVKGARRSKTYIVYMNGDIASKRLFGSMKVQPGCEIVVPVVEREDRERMNVAQWISLSSVAASMTTAIVALVRVL